MTAATDIGITPVPTNTTNPAVPVNDATDILAAIAASTVTVEFTSDANLTLSDAQWRASVLVFTDSPATLTAGRDVVFPDHFGHVFVRNDTAQILTLKKSGQAGVSLASGEAGMYASGSTDVESVASGGGLSDGDKGDITVSGSGAAWAIDNNAVTYAKMQDVSATARILGRKTAAAGDPEECTLSEVLDMIGAAADGDILMRSGGVWVRLGAGTNGHVLTLASGVPSWAAGGGGGLTNWTDGVSTSSPNATVPVVSLTATNAATNVDVALVPKGTGAIAGHVANNAASGGNKRGQGAVDLQLNRSAASQVASGSNSFIGSGRRNTASNGDAAVAGGFSNVASGQGAFIGAGTSNTSSGTYAFIGAGSSNLADAQDSWIPGGASANTRGVVGSGARASGLFSSSGDAQSACFVLRRSTTNATVTSLTTNGSAAAATNQVVLPSNSAYLVKATCVARENATGDSKTWEVTAHIKRAGNASTTALVGTPTVTALFNDAGAAAWALAVAADTTNGAIQFNVTGEASKTIRWVVDVYSCAQVAG